MFFFFTLIENKKNLFFSDIYKIFFKNIGKEIRLITETPQKASPLIRAFFNAVNFGQNQSPHAI